MAIYTTFQPHIKAEPYKNRTGLFDEPVLPKIVLRKEQKEAVNLAFKRFKKKGFQKFLWNAKMRFGKTICALQLARELGEQSHVEQRVHRTLIVTHRPVVNDSWHTDFDKIFGDLKENYRYGTKFDDMEEGTTFYQLEDFVRESPNHHYIFFVSMQYLRLSTLFSEGNNGNADTANEQLKQDILNLDWDMVVVDEAHEGTRTSLGQQVIDRLTKERTKMLHLSGTPFNLYEDFEDDQIYTWDYIMEQEAKANWNPKDGPNPYAELPKMNICTYDLGKLAKGEDYNEGDVFKFSEFFRTWTGNPRADRAAMPEGAKGKFVHEADVQGFLDLLCKEDVHSNYPFSTEEYQEAFNHTLWILPGVKEARAMKELLEQHEVFSNFTIVNVAGENADDEAADNALDRVRNAIGERPDETATITLSCGRLTTGVTVRPWTAVFYLKGSEQTSAATYMQTIFRVQSPDTKSRQGMMKSECYVFDFAPDRSLKMIAETAKYASLSKDKKKRQMAHATVKEEDIEQMKKFMHYCNVISLDGGRMQHYDAERLFEQLNQVYTDRIVRNGFNDNALYDTVALVDNMSDEDVEALEAMGLEIAKTTNMDKPKHAATLAKNGLTGNERAKGERAEKKKKSGESLTPEEQEALDKLKAEREARRKERDNRITILRGISLRIPLLIYGANVDDEDEGITLNNFTRRVDDKSWTEFMPKGVTKEMFNRFKKCYNMTRFNSAGKRIRQLAREADQMHTNDRIGRIAEIFSYFHNPDKETVLTPWRVVNMHLSDCIGGWCFFNERFDGPCERMVENINGKLFDFLPTNEPRRVDQGTVTADVFHSESRILEINSKTGLYPLYVAYSLFRERLKDYCKEQLIDIDTVSVTEEQVVWDDILQDNIFVICNTPMAARITERTLRGFRRVERMNIKETNLIERALDDREQLISDIQRAGFWKRTTKKDMIKFNAVVGNPPYQIMDGGAGVSAKPVYNTFVKLAKDISPNVISMIMPAKWYTDGKGLEAFRSEMLKDKRIFKLVDFTDSRECFENVDIAGGICYFLWNKDYNGQCKFVSKHQGQTKAFDRNLSESDNFIRHIEAISIIEKVKAISKYGFYNDKVSTRKPFGLSTNDSPLDSGDITLVYNGGKGYYKSSLITKGNDIIPKWKVIISRLTAEHAGQADKEGRKRVLSSLNHLRPNEICTETYLVVDSMDTEEEMNFLTSYLKTRFVRFLIAQLASTQQMTKEKFAFVPIQDFTSSSDIDWTQPVADIDQQLYKKYGLTQEETTFIERMIKPME